MKRIWIGIVLLAVIMILTACGTPSSGGSEQAGGHTHSFGEWEISQKNSCTDIGEKVRYCVCGEKQTETIATADHELIVDSAIAATCVSTGVTEGKHCSACGQVIVAQEIIPALGHTEVIDSAVAPSCTAEGLTEGKHCSVCNEVLAAQQVVVKLEHQEVTVAGKAPTAIVAGLSEGSICQICGVTLKEQTELRSIKDFVIQNATMIEDGEYTYMVMSDELNPNLGNKVFQITCSGSQIRVGLLEMLGSETIRQFTTLVFNESNATMMEYRYSYYLVPSANEMYDDSMRGYFTVSELDDLTSLNYSDTSSTIGGPASMQEERFEKYKSSACIAAKKTRALLNAFLEKNQFGYGIDVFGFDPY